MVLLAVDGQVVGNYTEGMTALKAAGRPVTLCFGPFADVAPPPSPTPAPVVDVRVPVGQLAVVGDVEAERRAALAAAAGRLVAPAPTPIEAAIEPDFEFFSEEEESSDEETPPADSPARAPAAAPAPASWTVEAHDPEDDPLNSLEADLNLMEGA